MAHRLEQHDYQKVQSLFEGPHLALVIDAVIAGNSPGSIWVDDVAHPRAALLWDKAHCFYLVGAADNAEFNQTARQLVAEKLLPEAIARHIGIFKVYYTSQDWERHTGIIFENISLAKMERVFYTFGELKIRDWRDEVPDGFSVRRIDQTLLADTGLKNLEAVIDEIESCWNALGDFLEHGFGFCMVSADEIAGWCTAEYVSGKKCGIGIETVEAHMRRGFATLTACAFVEHCLSNQITPHWDSWKANVPSVAVAEKVGFGKTEEYEVYVGRLKP